MFDDTWEWRGTTWHRLQPAESPPGRSSFGMATDLAGRRIVLFGGAPAPGGEAGDTWTWNGFTWTRERPASSPTPRTGGAMAFHRRLGRVVLFGGGNDENLVYADTWTWDGATWTRLDPATRPLGRTHPGAVAARDRVLLFGGIRSFTDYLDDTWLLLGG